MGAVIEGKEGVSGSNVYPTGAQSLGMFMADEGQGGSSNPIFDSEPEQQFAYNQGAGSDNFTGSLANRMTAGNLDDPNPQLLPDYLHGTGVCSNPIPAGLPASPQDWSGFGAVPDLANLVPSTGRALSRAGGVPNTGADILYFTPPLPADAEPLPAGRSLPEPKRAWTKEEEEYLVAAKMQGCTYPDISTAMNDEFKVDRSANVLSKKYREIMARNTQDSVSLVLLCPEGLAPFSLSHRLPSFLADGVTSRDSTRLSTTPCLLCLRS